MVANVSRSGNEILIENSGHLQRARMDLLQGGDRKLDFIVVPASED